MRRKSEASIEENLGQSPWRLVGDRPRDAPSGIAEAFSEGVLDDRRDLHLNRFQSRERLKGSPRALPASSWSRVSNDDRVFEGLELNGLVGRIFKEKIDFQLCKGGIRFSNCSAVDALDLDPWGGIASRQEGGHAQSHESKHCPCDSGGVQLRLGSSHEQESIRGCPPLPLVICPGGLRCM